MFVGCLLIQTAQFGLNRALSFSERRHSIAKFIDRKESFLIGIENFVDAILKTVFFSDQGLLPTLRRRRLLDFTQPAINLGANHGWIFQEL